MKYAIAFPAATTQVASNLINYEIFLLCVVIVCACVLEYAFDTSIHFAPSLIYFSVILKKLTCMQHFMFNFLKLTNTLHIRFKVHTNTHTHNYVQFIFMFG